MLNLRDPKLVLGSQRSASVGRLGFGTHEVVSTFVDFRTQDTQFTDPDAPQWSHHYNARFSEENEYQGPTRSAGVFRNRGYGIFKTETSWGWMQN